MSAERKLQLHEQFVRVEITAGGTWQWRPVASKSVLSAKLRKLTGPVRQHNGCAIIGNASISGPVGTVEPPTNEPPSGKLVVP